MSNGLLLDGQDFDQSLFIQREFTQQMLDKPSFDAVDGDTGIEGTPNDAGSVQTRVWNVAQIQAAMEEIVIAYEDLGSVDLPDELTAVSTIYNTTSSDGESTQNGIGGSEGSYATLSLSIHGSGQASASIQPDIQYSISVTPKDNVQRKIRTFFRKSPITIADVLTILSGPDFFNETVTLIPLFKKQVLTISLLGQQASYSATADVQERVEISQSNISKTVLIGSGKSASFGTSVRSIQLPATITPGFAIAGSQSATVSCVADAEIAGGVNWTAESSTITAGGTVTAIISPDIPATSQTSVATSGLALVKLDVTPFSGFNEMMIRAVVVDFGQFA